jgi:hypothetical protein
MALNKALREVAIEAVAASVALDAVYTGAVQGRFPRWLYRHRAWKHIRHLRFTYCIEGFEPVPKIAPFSLPVNPTSASLRLYFYDAALQNVPIPWSGILPFSNDAVRDIRLACDRPLKLDPIALLEAFPRLSSLHVTDVECDAISVEGPTFPFLVLVCEDSAGPARPGPILLRCPNLVSAAFRPSPTSRLPALSSGLQELALAEESVGTAALLAHFEGLSRHPSLQKLTFQFPHFDVDPLENYLRALSLVPSSVQHLAFHWVAFAGFLGVLAAFVLKAGWLPRLKTVYVIMDTYAFTPASRAALEQACLDRNVRHRILGCSQASMAKDLTSWPTSPWM